MSSICNPGRGSGRGLLALVVAACSLIGMSLPVALVQIIRQFEGTACTSLGTLGSGTSILWLMDLIMNSSSTAQGQQSIVDLRFGSFQAFADAVQWGIITVQKFSRREISLRSKLRFRLIEVGYWTQHYCGGNRDLRQGRVGAVLVCFVPVVCNMMVKRIVVFWFCWLSSSASFSCWAGTSFSRFAAHVFA